MAIGTGSSTWVTAAVAGVVVVGIGVAAIILNRGTPPDAPSVVNNAETQAPKPEDVAVATPEPEPPIGRGHRGRAVAAGRDHVGGGIELHR